MRRVTFGRSRRIRSFATRRRRRSRPREDRVRAHAAPVTCGSPARMATACSSVRSREPAGAAVRSACYMSEHDARYLTKMIRDVTPRLPRRRPLPKCRSEEDAMLRSADVFLPILPFSERIIDLSGPSATRPLAHAAATRTRRLRARARRHQSVVTVTMTSYGPRRTTSPGCAGRSRGSGMTQRSNRSWWRIWRGADDHPGGHPYPHRDTGDAIPYEEWHAAADRPR